MRVYRTMKKLFIALSVIFLGVSIAILKINTTANASGVLTVSGFTMEDGAAVRIAGEKANGLRFIAEIDEKTYENLTSQNAEFGMVIVPKDYITSGYELTVENLFGEEFKYSETAEVGGNQQVRRMLKLSGLTPIDIDNDGNLEISGAISDIIVSNLTREFVGVGYVRVGENYALADYYGGDENNNTRSMYYVAQKAIEKGDNADKVQSAYIDKFDEYLNGRKYPVDYTVNYIDTKNGERVIETKTYTGDLNEKITVSAEELDGYSLLSENELSKTLFANKPNEFNFYYLCEKERYTVTLLNVDGTLDISEVEVAEGETFASQPTPVLEGYAFDCWLLNGEEYDVNEPIDGDITLIAKWKASSDGGEKKVLSAYEVDEGVTFNSNTVGKLGVKQNPNSNWHTDSDYDESSLSFSQGAVYYMRKSSYIVLPKIDYSQYSKVDFCYYFEDDGATNLTVNGVSITFTGENIFIVITDGSGTYAVVRNIYKTTDPTEDYVVKIPLTNAQICGNEGIKLEFETPTNEYISIFISEFHTRDLTVDYIAKLEEILTKLPSNAEELTGSEEETALILEYEKYSAYRTEYEKSLGDPEVIIASRYRDVTFTNFDGTDKTVTVKVRVGEAVEVPENATPIREGYTFKGWLLDGEEYELSQAVTENLTLVAIWEQTAVKIEKGVISAEEINSAITVGSGVVKDGVKANAEYYYYDSDYGKTSDSYASGATFYVRKTSTVTLPKINFNLYTKVDFYYSLSLGETADLYIGETKIGELTGYKILIFITDGTGTYLIVRDINKKTDPLTDYDVKIKLTEEQSRGEEGVTVTVYGEGVNLFISEFHVWKMV